MDSKLIQHLKEVRDDIFHAVLEIGDVLAFQDTHHVEETINAFGDKQLKLDVLTD